jgi:hypothetical protein
LSENIKEIDYLEYDTIYLFTAIGFPHRVFVEEYEERGYLE